MPGASNGKFTYLVCGIEEEIAKESNVGWTKR